MIYFLLTMDFCFYFLLPMIFMTNDLYPSRLPLHELTTIWMWQLTHLCAAASRVARVCLQIRSSFYSMFV